MIGSLRARESFSQSSFYPDIALSNWTIALNQLFDKVIKSPRMLSK